MAAPNKMTAAPLEDRLAQLLAVLEARTKLLAFFFGLCFVAALLVLAVWFPQPTAFQYTVFRIVLALAAAGVAGVIPGMIRLKAQPGTALLIHAGGALAVFVMVYLLAPAALTKEQPAPPPFPSPPEKPVVSKPLKISNVDAIENNVHILNLSPPEAVRFARVSNLGDASVHISLIGFPEKYFYTNIEHEKSLLQGHADKNMSVVLLPTFFESEQKEYIFEVQDSAGGTARIEIRIHDGWPEYIAQQHQKINAKDEQGASAAEFYQTAKEIITESGYKELASPLQEVIAGQLLAAADQPEAAAFAYAKAKKENFGLAERFIANMSPSVKNVVLGADKKKKEKAADQPEAAALSYVKAKKETSEIAERFIANVSPSAKNVVSGDYKKKTSILTSVEMDIYKDRHLCNEDARDSDKEYHDKGEYFSEISGRKIVDLFGGGDNIRVEMIHCRYNSYSEMFYIDIDIYWDELLIKNNLCNISGELRISNEGREVVFHTTYASKTVRELDTKLTDEGVFFILPNVSMAEQQAAVAHKE